MLQIRRMKDCDLDQVAAIAASVFSMPWSRQGFAEALPMENACFLVASKDGEVCGYCGAYLAADEGEIINVAVDPGFQRQGIAELLLIHLLQEGKNGGVHRFFLEVRVSNTAAICLYEKAGFQIQGIRKGFYADNHEDAYVMNLLQEQE